MRKVNASVASFVGGLLVMTTAAFAEDWPQWRGANRDGKTTQFAEPSSWPDQLSQEWTATVGLGDSSPALVGGKLIVFARQGDDEVILCLDASDGTEIWRDSYPSIPVTGGARGHSGPRSSPTVSNGKVVTLGVGGILSCLDLETGKVAWRKDEFPGAVPAFYTSMSPLIVDGLCVAHLGGKEKGAVIAYDLQTGDPQWRWDGDGPAYASPVLMNVDGSKHVVVETEKSVVGISLAEGRLLWQVAFLGGQRSTNSSSPVVDGNIVYLSASGRGTKALAIEKADEGYRASEIWINDTLGTGFNTAVLKAGFLFGLSDAGKLFCMNAENGQAAWIDESRHQRFGAVVDAGSVMLALSSSSELIAYRPSESRYEELARFKVSETPIYAHPIIAGNRIFVKDQESVTMWTVD